jgi:hypothetical protein
MKFLDLFRNERVKEQPVVSVEEEIVKPENAPEPSNGVEEEKEKSIDIPEEVFVEYDHPSKKHKMEEQNAPEEIFDLDKLYKFLDQNLEKKGYEDALVNPDTFYMDQHVRILQNELDLLVARIQNDYRTHINKIDFHLDTRKRSGMIETVEELLTHKKTVEQNIQEVTNIHADSKRGEGLSQNIILSYKKGFQNGFAAITFNTILIRKK